MNREQEKLMLELGYILGDQKGVDFLWRLLEQAGVFRTSFNASEPLRMAFNEGKRDMGLFLIGLISGYENGAYLTKLLGQGTNGRNSNRKQWTDGRACSADSTD